MWDLALSRGVGLCNSYYVGLHDWAAARVVHVTQMCVYATSKTAAAAVEQTIARTALSDRLRVPIRLSGLQRQTTSVVTATFRRSYSPQPRTLRLQ